ncbi:hypothetical protein NUW54_g3493 [Trametes sanguinea]|uniref:Uncharacterized protein n=1 Tax=Trametes sanguinea TaxID=158606 RepID=A0ACC1Q3E1_9APHY|nr:hypothetical protein NUW54_g3493 [Trametes sanguinea]
MQFSTFVKFALTAAQIGLVMATPFSVCTPFSLTLTRRISESYGIRHDLLGAQWDMLDSTYEFECIPCSLWPYVRNLSFTGCFTRDEIQWLNLAIDHQLDPYLLEEEFNERLKTVKQNSVTLREAMGSMQSLTSIDICLPHQTDPRDPERITGISPYILEAILSTPHLRHLSIAGPLFHPRDSLPPDTTCPSLAELSSFNYYYDLERSSAQISGAEREQITRILACAHGHLEELNLPAECASIDQMGSWKWPSLRNLVLRGETVASSKPLAHMLSKMPRLRSISLFLAEPVDSSHSPSSWPSSPALQLKWHDFETLDITHPHPEAEIYSHLSHNLLSLGLRCWPRHYKLNTRFKEDLPAGGAQWSSPLLSSSEMLRILQRVDAPRLHDLELEFRADYSDAQLFRHIGSAFPSLKGLCIHCRYRMTGVPEFLPRRVGAHGEAPDRGPVCHDCSSEIK